MRLAFPLHQPHQRLQILSKNRQDFGLLVSTRPGDHQAAAVFFEVLRRHRPRTGLELPELHPTDFEDLQGFEADLSQPFSITRVPGGTS